ncbi:ATP-binding protein [Ilumatobacter sp.]|uniref:ATP-binding protein n=1 Tax=Ilumatobacter sp. TaxID=1967498 RepID=UPI003B519F6A
MSVRCEQVDGRDGGDVTSRAGRGADELDPRSPVRLLAIVVALSLLTAVTTIAVFLIDTNRAVVQGVEVDAAGRQRRLSERIAYDAARLAREPADDATRAELRWAAEMLHAIRTGLLVGDAELDLDGEIPPATRALYSADGLDLTARLDRLERAATGIASDPGPPDVELRRLIDDEAVGQRIVFDLNRVVESLAATEGDERAATRGRAVIGLATTLALAVVALAALVSVRRRLARQLALRARLSAEVASSEDLYRTTVDSLHDAVVVQDHDGFVVRTNDAARRMLAPFAVDGRIETGVHLADVVPGLRDEAGRPLRPEERPTRRVLGGAGPVVGEIYQLRSDGDRRWFRTNAATVTGADGRSRRVVLTFADVTDERLAHQRSAEEQRAELEREQELVAKLLALDDARNNFVSTVSHELRTPLTSLVGYLEMLEDGTAGDLDEMQVSMDGASVRNAHRLRRLIDDLLEISTAEQGARRDRSVPVAVRTLVERVVEAIAPIAIEAGVDLVASDVAEDLRVAGDASELERVLINLVGNAIKFTPGSGSVTIETAVDSTSGTTGDTRHGSGDRVRISVVDTGVGIPSGEQEHVFTRFFRTESATRDQIQGSGLGLTIAAKLTKAHGGTIELSSDVGVGTTVTIELPLLGRTPVTAGGFGVPGSTPSIGAHDRRR